MSLIQEAHSHVVQCSRVCHLTESSTKLEFSEIKASSRSESVYSGRRKGYTTMPSLTDLCTMVLSNNIDGKFVFVESVRMG